MAGASKRSAVLPIRPSRFFCHPIIFPRSAAQGIGGNRFSGLLLYLVEEREDRDILGDRFRRRAAGQRATQSTQRLRDGRFGGKFDHHLAVVGGLAEYG